MSKSQKASTIKGLEPFHLPSDEEIGEAYDQGKEVVIALFHRTVGQLAILIQALEDRISKNRQTIDPVRDQQPQLPAEQVTAVDKVDNR